MACYALPPSGNAMSPASFLRTGDAGFPAAFGKHIGRPVNGILLADSGTSALYVALRAVAALKGPGRVAVPAWCCPSVPQAAVQAGLEPVPIDLDPDTLEYDPAELRAAREHPDRLAAVVLVHFFGRPAARPAGDWAGTLFIRDCAQDFEFRPGPLETAPCVYSFGRGKALNAGHGGALCLPPAGPFADACRAAHAALPESRAHPLGKALAINVLSHPRVFWAVTALPGLGIGATVWDAPLSFARISPAFPRLGSACLEAYLRRRRAYRALIARYRALAEACDPARVRTPAVGADALGTRFPLLFGDAELRERCYAALKARFGGVTRMYPAILGELPGAPPGFAGGRGPDAFPGARRVAREIVTLPVAAALIGREDAFLSCLEGSLREAGALRPGAGGAPDWAAEPAGAVPAPGLGIP